jgi:hypothetical protein
MYVGVILFFAEVLYVVGKHDFNMALVLAMGGLAIIVVMSVYIKVCFGEGLRFFYSRVGALGAAVTALLWGLWYVVYLAALSMKPGGDHPALAFLGRAAMLSPILLVFFVMFVGGGIAIVIAVRRAINPAPEQPSDKEPYLAQPLSPGGKKILTGFVLVVGFLLGLGAWQGGRDIFSDDKHSADPAKTSTSAHGPNRPGQHGTVAARPSAGCDVGKFTANSGTLRLFAPEVNAATGEMVVNGVDSARPTAPFRFTWGDGAVTVGWFPQRKIYQKPPYSKETNYYKVWVVATHPDGSQAEAAVAIQSIGEERD